MANDVSAIYLTPGDQEILQQLIQAWKGKPQNKLPRYEPPLLGSSRGVYVALPETTISALTASGTGTTLSAEQGDHAGSGLCEIYRLVDGDLYPTGKLERVYNSSRSTISREWIQVHQDRYGHWWAITASASTGGTQIIIGTPTITNPGTGTSSNAGVAFAEEEVQCEILSGTDFGTEALAFVRKGLVFPGGDYIHYLAAIDGAFDNSAAYEIMDPFLEFLGYTTNDVIKGGTVNVDIYRGAPQAIFTYTGESILVECNYGDINSGSLVRCRWIDGLAWEVVNAECDVTGTGT